MALFKKFFIVAFFTLLPSLYNASNEYTQRPFCGLTTDIKIGFIEHPCGTPFPRNSTSTNVNLCRDTFRMRSTMKIQIRNMYNKYRNHIGHHVRSNSFHIKMYLPTRASLNITKTLKDLQIYALGLSCIGEAMNYQGIFQSSNSWIMAGRFREPSDSGSLCYVLNDIRQMMCVLSQDDEVSMGHHLRHFHQMLTCSQFHRLIDSGHRDRLFVQILSDFYDYLNSLSYHSCTQ